MNHTPTPRQARVLEVYQNKTASLGLPPTLAEVADALEISRSTVLEHVRGLVKRGLLVHAPGEHARAYSLPNICPACRRPLDDA